MSFHTEVVSIFAGHPSRYYLRSMLLNCIVFNAIPKVGWLQIIQSFYQQWVPKVKEYTALEYLK